MEHEYWLSRWQNGEIGFDQSQPNTHLVTYWRDLALAQGASVFVPLCGKSIDVQWLWQQGFDVVAAELSESAVAQLFAAMQLTPDISEENGFICYRAERLTVFVGDIFRLTRDQIVNCQGIYDRGALVALNYDLRTQYAQQLVNLCPNAKQLLITVQYPQPEANSTPQSITAQEVSRLYAKHYEIKQLAHQDMEEGIKGFTPASSTVWMFTLSLPEA